MGRLATFRTYTAQVNGFLPESIAGTLAVVATSLEILLPAMLLGGFKTRYAAFASGMLLMTFGLAMTFSFGVKAPLDYSVFTSAAASFVLMVLTSKTTPEKQS